MIKSIVPALVFLICFLCALFGCSARFSMTSTVASQTGCHYTIKLTRGALECQAALSEQAECGMTLQNCKYAGASTEVVNEVRCARNVMVMCGEGSK